MIVLKVKRFTHSTLRRNPMRNKFVSIVAASTIAFSALVTSASAGDRYYRGHHDRDRAVAGAIVGGNFGALIGSAIANSGLRYAPAPRYYDEPPRHHGGYRQPRIQHYGGGWVNKRQYERLTGRGCPGPIDYVNGTYICQIN